MVIAGKDRPVEICCKPDGRLVSWALLLSQRGVCLLRFWRRLIEPNYSKRTKKSRKKRKRNIVDRASIPVTQERYKALSGASLPVYLGSPCIAYRKTKVPTPRPLEKIFFLLSHGFDFEGPCLYSRKQVIETFDCLLLDLFPVKAIIIAEKISLISNSYPVVR